jgi:hypothetical protein
MDWQRARRKFSTAPFDSLRESLEPLIGDAAWPGIARLNQCAAGISNFRGQPIRFVANDDITATAHYEIRIAETGQVATRENWHDFFNAMSWLSFPEAKSAISEMHARLLSAHGEKELRERSTPRDVLTLFDEGGMIVTSSDESLLDLVRGFEWKKLFVERRMDVMGSMRFYLFGHSMLEKALDPYVGVTAKAILLKVDDAFLSSSHAAQVRQVDHRVAAWLMDEAKLSSSKNFSPLPWLGVPGWWTGNESPAFYDNEQYFRRGRLRDVGEPRQGLK